MNEILMMKSKPTEVYKTPAINEKVLDTIVRDDPNEVNKSSKQQNNSAERQQWFQAKMIELAAEKGGDINQLLDLPTRMPLQSFESK